MVETKKCPCCDDEVERDDFEKCQFCDSLIIGCDDCIKEHFENKHYDPHAITDEEYEDLEDIE